MFASAGSTGRAPDTRPLHRTLSATSSAPGASRGRRASRYRSYSGLRASMKARSNGPARRGSRGGEGVERRRVDDRDLLVGDPALPPPAAGQVGPDLVGVDRHDRAARALPVGHPQRRVAVRRPDLDDPPPPAGQDRQDASRVAIDDRDACAARRRPRSPPAPAAAAWPTTRSSRGRPRRGSSSVRSCPWLPHTSNPAPK